MRYLGNIITDVAMPDSNLFKQVNSVNLADSTLPTIIIGTKLSKELLGDKFDILNWKAGDNMYWTFGQREKRDRNENDMQRFRTIAIQRALSSVKYKFANVLNMPHDHKEKLFETLSNNLSKVAYISNNMVYINLRGTDVVYGISLLDIEYSGIGKTKLLNLIHGNKSIQLVDTNNKTYFELLMAFRDKEYMLPYLMS